MSATNQPGNRQVLVVKSGKGCWTCKARKIACDQKLPLCNNCIRTGRLCEGYGIKLHWPESPDGRRPLCQWDSKPQELLNYIAISKSRALHFLNTTYDDLSSRASSKSSRRRIFCNPQYSSNIPRGVNVGFKSTDLEPEDKRLLTYYHEVLSRLLSTIDDSRNGFRTILIPSALSGISLSSQSLREAILAMSAFHLQGNVAALKHKLRAIRLLSESISKGEKQYASQFAASMMLCICDGVFDAAHGRWYTHLLAAKAFCDQAKAMPTGGETTYFLTTWLQCCKVLAEFSHDDEKCNHVKIVPQLPCLDIQNKVIIGSFGCSMQVLECISCINQLSHTILQSPSKIVPAEFASIPQFLHVQLETLQQIPGIVEDGASGRVDEARIMSGAENFRLAALIYLHRSIILTPSNSELMKDLVSRSLGIMEELGVYTSPWPLFVTACEVVGDGQRFRILDIMDIMQKERPLVNVNIIKNIIEALWKQTDLHPCSKGSLRVDWKSLVDLEDHVPCFL